MKILILLVFLIVSNTNGREIYLLENVKHRERGLGSKFFQPIDRQDAVDPALADLITVSISISRTSKQSIFMIMFRVALVIFLGASLTLLQIILLILLFWQLLELLHSRAELL